MNHIFHETPAPKRLTLRGEIPVITETVSFDYVDFERDVVEEVVSREYMRFTQSMGIAVRKLDGLRLMAPGPIEPQTIKLSVSSERLRVEKKTIVSEEVHVFKTTVASIEAHAQPLLREHLSVDVTEQQ